MQPLEGSRSASPLSGCFQCADCGVGSSHTTQAWQLQRLSPHLSLHTSMMKILPPVFTRLGWPLRWTSSLSWVIYNYVGFTLPPRLGRGVISDSRAVTRIMLFDEVYSDISLNCHQTCRSTHADHFVSHLAYVSNQSVILPFDIACRCNVLCLGGPWVCLLFWFKWPFAQLALLQITASFRTVCSSKLAFCLVWQT